MVLYVLMYHYTSTVEIFLLVECNSIHLSLHESAKLATYLLCVIKLPELLAFSLARFRGTQTWDTAARWSFLLVWWAS